jgi:hypothetical protein
MLEPIPSTWRVHAIPYFVRWRDEWHVIGADFLLPVGRIVSATRHGQPDVDVLIAEHVAERTVRHREGSYTHQQRGAETRFVIARIDIRGENPS